jgi:hypothetical protein
MLAALLARRRCRFNVRQDVAPNGRPDRGALDSDDDMPPPIEAHQRRPRDGRGGELGVVVELEPIVPGVNDQGRRADRGDPIAGQPCLVVEHHAGRARRGRVHVVDEALDDLALLDREGGDHLRGRAEHAHELALEVPGYGPV